MRHYIPAFAQSARVATLILVVGLMAQTAAATVLVNGNVRPSDNPFTINANEGIPVDGNFINPFEPATAAGQTQFEFTGGRNAMGNIIPLPQVDGVGAVIVGETSFGVMLISGESALRSETLIVGTSGELSSGQIRGGTGVVRITGFGSLYNNDPFILPFEDPTFLEFGTIRDETAGYDVYVGTASADAEGAVGTGTLEISAGARAEIQDAVVVGNVPGSTGSIIVDGFDSFLGSGGFAGGAVTGDDPHQMLIGRQGVGFMTISTGGTVVSEAPTGTSAADVVVGAVIGGDPFEPDTGTDLAGGTGTVTVTGTASKWIVGGSLQVGGFDEGVGLAGAADLEGDDTVYAPTAGRGTLNVQDGGLVNVRASIDAAVDDDLFLAIGRFGRIVMSGGLIVVDAPGDTEEDGTPDTVQLINDGVIEGTGRIETGVFRNRYRGEVRVGPGESLVIDSTAELAGLAPVDPLSNFGVIRVLGTEDQPADLEFERSLEDPPAGTTEPFRNLRVPRPMGAPLADFFGGLISAQHSVLKFRSSIENEGMMAFTNGTNYVVGDVFNFPAPPMMPLDPGIIFISGPETLVVFENDLINAGTLIIEEGADVDILARHSFVTSGNLSVSLNPTNPTHISVPGDAGITGKLTVTMSGFSPGSLFIGQEFEIISVTGQLGGVDLTDPFHPAVDLSVPPMFTAVMMPSLASFGLPASAVLLPVFTANSVLLRIVDSLTTTPLAGDYNNDGVVNAADYVVWRKNAGTSNILPNDPFGGVIGSSQYNMWRANFGSTFPGSGSGGGSAVPEPASLAILLTNGLLALTWRRRRDR